MRRYLIFIENMKKQSMRVFESLNKLGIKESENAVSYKCEKVDYTSLNKRFLSL